MRYLRFNFLLIPQFAWFKIPYTLHTKSDDTLNSIFFLWVTFRKYFILKISLYRLTYKGGGWEEIKQRTVIFVSLQLLPVYWGLLQMSPSLRNLLRSVFQNKFLPPWNASATLCIWHWYPKFLSCSSKIYSKAVHFSASHSYHPHPDPHHLSDGPWEQHINWFLCFHSYPYWYSFYKAAFNLFEKAYHIFSLHMFCWFPLHWWWHLTPSKTQDNLAFPYFFHLFSCSPHAHLLYSSYKF